MKVLDVPKSGKRGKTVAFPSRFGQCERRHNKPTKPRTAAQLRAQSAFGAASLGWNQLTEEECAAWRAAGKKVRSHPRGGQSGPLSGQNFFTAINRNQALLGLEPFRYPPERPAFELNPVRGFSITLERRGIAFKLSVPIVPTGYMLVYASRPYNANRHYCDKFIYLSLLPAPVRGVSDIASGYLAKLGMPWPGSRVILQIVQQVNGWRDQPMRFEAVFRPVPSPVAPTRRRHPSKATL